MNREALWSGRQDPCSSKEVRHRPAQSAEPRGRRVSARYEHQVPTALRRGQAHRLPQPPFCSVPYDRVPNSPPHRKAYAAHVSLVAPGDQHQPSIRPCTPVPPGRSEVAGPPEACVPGHQPTGANLHEQTSYSKPAPPFEHASPQHAAAAAGPHTRSEPVDAGPAPFLWLIGPFRHTLPANTRLYAAPERGVNLALFIIRRGGSVSVVSSALTGRGHGHYSRSRGNPPRAESYRRQCELAPRKTWFPTGGYGVGDRIKTSAQACGICGAKEP